ncbi:amino acid ABC transporter permease [Enterococcus asini]|uniref:amino acid ABC transporter permease n=1 Tax=Enterococcus asini TaxID=57732 RepID=UPI00288D5CD7|nr:amino acid ABC transporter permease [Enterococcus asini]MDT2756845.1 amino acid ABC transporter permease [Enterococcus asini]
MNFQFLTTYYPYFIYGTMVTLIISIVTIVFGTLIGVLMALLKLSKLKLLRLFANLYIEIFRGTPMLLQIMIGFTLLQNLFRLPLISIGILDIDLSRLLPGIIVISLNSGAYVAEIVRGGINGVDYGQSEAAGSLGMRPLQTMRYVILPQALRNILPPLGNEFIVLIKDSSLLSIIGIYDLMNSAQIVISSSFNPLGPYLIAGLIYLVLTFTTSRLLNHWEKYLGKGYHR